MGRIDYLNLPSVPQEAIIALLESIILLEPDENRQDYDLFIKALYDDDLQDFCQRALDLLPDIFGQIQVAGHYEALRYGCGLDSRKLPS